MTCLEKIEPLVCCAEPIEYHPLYSYSADKQRISESVLAAAQLRIQTSKVLLKTEESSLFSVRVGIGLCSQPNLRNLFFRTKTTTTDGEEGKNVK